MLQMPPVEMKYGYVHAQVDLACDAAHEAVRKRKEQEASGVPSIPQVMLIIQPTSTSLAACLLISCIRCSITLTPAVWAHS